MEQDYLTPNKTLGCASSADGLKDIETIFKSPDDIGSVEILEKYIYEIIERKIKNKQELEGVLRELNKKYHTMGSCMKLLYVYRSMCKRNLIEFNVMYEELFQSKGFRSQSGVLVVAVFTSPYPETMKDGVMTKQAFSCEYDCYYCPAEPNQPRSYLLNEPGVRRANHNKFDAVNQFRDRIGTYIAMGHPIDKIELIVLGGTWSSYPKDYQDSFIRDVMYAANTLYETRDRLSLVEEQKINETSDCRIIGITLETRPDRINERELKNFRRLGVTRIQMGVQHLDDRILYRINRRCTSAQAIRSIKMAKDCGFKIDIHLMPDLPQPLKEGVSNIKQTFTPDDIDQDFDMLEADKKMFDTVINSPDWQVDQWKIYPCEVVPWTRIETDFKNGAYKPYGHQTNSREKTPLTELLIDTVSKVKPWVRLNRIIRDIPTEYIMGGNCNVSMRQDLDLELKKRGLFCMDIRNREVKKRNIDPTTAILKVRKYDSSGGDEYFISFETPDEKVLFGFLRLRLSTNAGFHKFDDEYIFPELKKCAMIRELHVYGQVKKVNEKKTEKDINGTAQHVGFGKQLVNKAFEIARENGFEKISVISGIGVKNYYRKFGFEDEEYFMTMAVPKIEINTSETINNIITSNKMKKRNIRFSQIVEETLSYDDTQVIYFMMIILFFLMTFGIYKFFY